MIKALCNFYLNLFLYKPLKTLFPQSLFSTSAFGMGMEYIIRLEEQGVGLQGHTLTQGVVSLTSEMRSLIYSFRF